MTAFLNIGNTWDFALLKGIASIPVDPEYEVIVDTLFGCTKSNLLGNARSPDRIQNLNMKKTAAFIDEAHAQNLKIAWTINESCVGNVKEFIDTWDANGEALTEFFEYLSVDSLIVANPLIMLKLATSSIDIPITISTIANITEPNQLMVLIDRGCHITKFCVPVARNRDLNWLHSMNKVSGVLGIEMEVIVNEFCFLDGCNCEGLFRRSCYDMNAHAELGDQDSDSSWFPREICTTLREKDPVNWLKAKWILPQDMYLYEEIGINHFKITGRTHPTDFLLTILPYYLVRYFEGNLLELWPHLQTIGKKDFLTEQEKVLKGLYIDTRRLEDFVRDILKICMGDCSVCDFCEREYNRNT